MYRLGTRYISARMVVILVIFQSIAFMYAFYTRIHAPICPLMRNDTRYEKTMSVLTDAQALVFDTNVENVVTYEDKTKVLADARMLVKCLEDPEDKSAEGNYYAAGGDPELQMKLDYLSADSVVFDVGGNKGGFVSFAVNYPAQLHVFEPIKEFYDFLVEKYDRKAYPNTHFHHWGLDRGDGDSRIVIEGAQGSASSQYRSEDVGRGELVHMKSVSTAMREIGVRQVHMMNINCEGCEFAIMESIVDAGLVRNFTRIQVQYHPNVVKDGAVRRCNVRKALMKTHKEEYNFPWIWERWAAV